MNELALELIIPREGTEAKWMLRKECIMSSFFGMPPALDNLIYDKFVQDQEDLDESVTSLEELQEEKEQPQQQNNKAVQGKKPINSQRGHKQS